VPPPPNIVIVLADDLGWGDLGCYGHPLIRTPNLDAFAKEGMRLTHCYSASAVCSPSRSAIMTGRTPHRNGVYTWIQEGSEVHLRTTELTLPRLLKQHGYETCHVGKWHLNGKFNHAAQPQPNDHGYDWWLATQNNAAPNHQNPTNFVRNGQRVGRLEGSSASLVVDEAARWLKERRNKSKPYFLTVWTHEPHLPIESDPELLKLYTQIDDADLRQHHANVTQLDRAFGQLMKALAETQQAENTFVFFTSDNGPEGDGTKGRTRGSTGGLRGRKRALYEGGIRVPGIARFPGRIPAGTTCNVPIIGTDLFPTAIAIARGKLPTAKPLDGVNVLPLLLAQEKSLERQAPLYWRLNMATHGLHIAMRQGDWKLLASQDLKKFELYNLKDDPGEAINLWSKAPERDAGLKHALTTLNEAIEAEGPDWWKRLSPNGGGPVKR
jgi:arylsulfatase A